MQLLKGAICETIGWKKSRVIETRQDYETLYQTPGGIGPHRDGRYQGDLFRQCRGEGSPFSPKHRKGLDYSRIWNAPSFHAYPFVSRIPTGRASGRTFEIQRLIGRSLRSIADLTGFGERTIWIDCDVIQADGGTRTASITGAYVAMVDAFRKMLKERQRKKIPIKDSVAAISVGKVEGNIVLDLNYEEDSRAEVDMNVVMTGQGGFVEIQGTAEGAVFSKQEMDDLVRMAQKGIQELTKIQKKVLSLPPLPSEGRGKR